MSRHPEVKASRAAQAASVSRAYDAFHVEQRLPRVRTREQLAEQLVTFRERLAAMSFPPDETTGYVRAYALAQTRRLIDEADPADPPAWLTPDMLAARAPEWPADDRIIARWFDPSHDADQLRPFRAAFRDHVLHRREHGGRAWTYRLEPALGLPAVDPWQIAEHDRQLKYGHGPS